MTVGIDIGTQSLKAVVLDDGLRPRGQRRRAPTRPSLSAAGLGRAGSAALGGGAGPGGRRAPWRGRRRRRTRSARSASPASSTAASRVGRDGRAAGAPASSGWTGAPSAETGRHRRPSASAPAPALVLDAGHMAAKIALAQAPPAGAARSRRFHQPVSYLVERLTGERVIDHGLASTTHALRPRPRATTIPACWPPSASTRADAAGDREAAAGRLR